MLDLSIFQNESIRLDEIAVHHAFVKPTDEFICRPGSKQFDRFFYIAKGTIHFEPENGNNFSATAGDIVYLPNDCRYICHWDSEPIGEHYSLKFVLLDRNNKICTTGDRIEIVTSDRHKKYFSMMEEFYKVWIKGELGYIIKCNMLLWDFLHNLYLDVTAKNLKSENNSIYKSILYLQNNYIADVSPDYLANLCNMSLTSFRRYFKATTGTSPVKYKNDLRMEKALSLLKTGEYNVTEAAISVGCPDIYYFSKLFKKKYNKNPSDFIQ